MPSLASLEQALSQRSSDERPALSEADASVEVIGVTHDSRQVQPGWLYVALPGRATHGAHFIPQALARGAVAIAAPVDLAPTLIPDDVPMLWLTEPRREMAWLSEWVWGTPLRELSLLGVTGTNGKTTTTSLLAEILTRSDGDVGLLGTIAARGGGLSEASSMTTLEAPALHQRFAAFVKAQVKRCVMEVSSIGIAEERVAAARFDRVAFLNLSEDHLDYHEDMESYLSAKERLMGELLAPDALALVNIDDPAGGRICQVTRDAGARLWRLSAARALSDEEAAQIEVEVYWRTLTLSEAGLSGELVTPHGALSLRSQLLGAFNAYNVATAAAIARSLDIDDEAIQAGVEACVVSGRMQRVSPLQAPDCARPYPKVLVDYAHSPDALERALEALRPLCRGRLLCLFGCGGDRDAQKRPLMGYASSRADLVFLTSDNPRFEDPDQIIREALTGCERGGLHLKPSPELGAVWCQPDRAKAIEAAVALMGADDLLLIAGKGHEPYQEVRGARRPFDDVEQASVALDEWLRADALLERELSTRALCEATGGRLLHGAHRRLSGGEIDTRRLSAGEAFFCVQGARDGHEFALSALERGAGALITKRGWASGARSALLEALNRQGASWIEVEDPEEALRGFASRYRSRAFKGCLLGLTGSNGKTSTKELLAAALSQRGPTLATEGNFNNHLGVPLTLMRLRPLHRYAVIEMGMSARHEIELLAALSQPQLGLITTVAPAHLEGLGSLEEVARAKGELFVGLGAQGEAICSSLLPCYEHVMEGVEARVWHADERLGLSEMTLSESGSEATLTDLQSGERHLLSVRLVGAHQLENARLALCAGLRAEARCADSSSGATEVLTDLLRGLASCPPPPMRGEVSPLPARGDEDSGALWLDCYNANPQSTLASARTFWETGHRGVLTLGSLKELGPSSAALHRALGASLTQTHAALHPEGPQPEELIICVGEEARYIGEGMAEAGYPSELISSFKGDERALALETILRVLRASPQASLFVKGSRSGRLEQVAAELIETLSLDDAPRSDAPRSPTHRPKER